MRDLSLHILDIAENSVMAGAAFVQVLVNEDLENDQLTICIQDDGRGMESAELVQASDPFSTRRTTRKVGLGIPFFKAAAEACNGSMTIDSIPGQGTQVEVRFQHSHIDRMPLGDLAGTMLTLLISFPDTHWEFIYQVNGQRYIFDDEPVKVILAGVPLTEPAILAYLRREFQEGIQAIRREKATSGVIEGKPFRSSHL